VPANLVLVQQESDLREGHGTVDPPPWRQLPGVECRKAVSEAAQTNILGL
jgi:hypothetical protein